MSKRNCTHWWRVPAPHLGPDALATCKRCRATRKFPRTLLSQAWSRKWSLSRKAWSSQVKDLQERLHAAENAQ